MNSVFEMLNNVPVNTMTLNDLYKAALDIQNDCRDFEILKANESNIRFSADVGKLKYLPINSSDARSVDVSNYSLNQLCIKLGIPARYVERCIQSGDIELAACNLNAWLEEYDKPLLIREYKNRVRGILSNRYMIMDSPDIIKTIMDNIDESAFSIKNYFLSEERFHARIVSNKMLNINGEDLYAGIQVDSSDVGRSIINIRFLLFKLVCTNGLTITKGDFNLFKKKHLGMNNVDFALNFKTCLSNLNGMIELVPTLIEGARNDVINTTALFESPETFNITHSLRDRYGVSNSEIENIYSVLGSGKYSNTRWGLVNSITEAAQNYTLERRLILEDVAGSILVR